MKDKTTKTLQWLDGMMYHIDAAGNQTPQQEHEDVFDQQAPQATPPPANTAEADNGYRALSETFFNTLPDMLRIPCTRFEDGAERELFVVGALGIISGMLPNYMGNYFGNRVATNLYAYIIGAYGSGKGALKWAQQLGNATHKYRVQLSKDAMTKYLQDKSVYSQQSALYTKGKLEEPPVEPQEPKHLKLFIPANTTKTAVVQLLEENDGRGIIFETEGDTLADMLKQEYGNFSDILRKAFHHEPISFFRRANNEDVAVSAPSLSVVLSGTYDQLLKLIPSIENGLYSRFMFYMLDGNDDFRDPFSELDEHHEYHFTQYSNDYLRLYQMLNALQTPISFKLPKELKTRFVNRFRTIKEWTREKVSEDLNGSVNRMALMAYRIAMILSILRHYKAHGNIHTDNITCNQTDYENAVALVEVLSYNATDVYRYLEANGYKRTTPPRGGSATDEEKTLCYRYHMDGKSNKQIAIEVFGNINSDKKVGRIIRKYKQVG